MCVTYAPGTGISGTSKVPSSLVPASADSPGAAVECAPDPDAVVESVAEVE